jgi:3-keto-L-gulonate-6-phosphate decarboxylase
MVKLQLAMDKLDGDVAIKLAASSAPYADIFEAGKPLIKSVGINIVNIRIREIWPA